MTRRGSSIGSNLRSGSVEIGEWRHETVNLYEDYRNFFGEAPGKSARYRYSIQLRCDQRPRRRRLRRLHLASLRFKYLSICLGSTAPNPASRPSAHFRSHLNVTVSVLANLRERCNVPDPTAASPEAV
jgi:hypothetical protein